MQTLTTVNPNQALWEKGDFTRIAATMRESGEALVNALGITRGLKVLDLGCGDGTTALPEVRLGAEVLGVDISRNLVEAATTRANQEGLTNCSFQQGDACNLHETRSRLRATPTRSTFTALPPSSWMPSGAITARR